MRGTTAPRPADSFLFVFASFSSFLYHLSVPLERAEPGQRKILKLTCHRKLCFSFHWKATRRILGKCRWKTLHRQKHEGDRRPLTDILRSGRQVSTHTHTHTHTKQHTYIYIYIYIYTRGVSRSWCPSPKNQRSCTPLYRVTATAAVPALASHQTGTI